MLGFSLLRAASRPSNPIVWDQGRQYGDLDIQTRVWGFGGGRRKAENMFTLASALSLGWPFKASEKYS